MYGASPVPYLKRALVGVLARKVAVVCSLPAICPSRGLHGPRLFIACVAGGPAPPRPTTSSPPCFLRLNLEWRPDSFGYVIKFFAARPRTRECMGHSRALARWPNLLLVGTIAVDLYLLLQHGAACSGNRTSPACATQTHPCEDPTQSKPIRVAPTLTGVEALGNRTAGITPFQVDVDVGQDDDSHFDKLVPYLQTMAGTESRLLSSTYWQEDKWQEPGEWSVHGGRHGTSRHEAANRHCHPVDGKAQAPAQGWTPTRSRIWQRCGKRASRQGWKDERGPPSTTTFFFQFLYQARANWNFHSHGGLVEQGVGESSFCTSQTGQGYIVSGTCQVVGGAEARKCQKYDQGASPSYYTPGNCPQNAAEAARGRDGVPIKLGPIHGAVGFYAEDTNGRKGEDAQGVSDQGGRAREYHPNGCAGDRTAADGHSRGQHGAHPGRRGLRRAHASPSPCRDHLSANAGSGLAEFQGDDAALCWQQEEGCPWRLLGRRGDGKARQGSTRGQPEEARRAPGTSFSRFARYFLAFAAFPTGRWSGTAGTNSYGAPWTGPVIRLTRTTGRCSDIVGFLHSVHQQIDFISPLAAHLLGLQRAHEARCHALDCGFLEYDPRINPDSPMRWMPGKEAFDWSLIEMQCLAADQAVPGAYRRMDSSSVVEPDSGCQSPRLATLHELPLNGTETGGECPAAHVGSSVHSVHTTCTFSKQAGGLGSTKSCLRGPSTPTRAASGAKVRFNFAVQFWFPAPFQVTLPPSADQDLKAMATAAQAEHAGLRSPFPLTQAEHAGFCSPHNTTIPLVPSENFVIFEDADCTTCPVAPDLGYRQNCDHFAARGFTSPSGSPKPCCFPASSDALRDVTNFVGSDLAVEHVGLRSPLPRQSHSSSPFTSSSLVKGGSCRSFPAEGLYPSNGPLALTAVRKKPQAKPTLLTRPGTPDHAMPVQGTLGYRVGGMSCTPTPAACAGSALPDDIPQSKVPYSAFDSVVEHRALLADPDWEEWRFVIEAIKSSVFPGNPLGRFMRHHVTGYPTPQVMITPAKRFEIRGSVVFDLRRLECGIEVVDISPGTSIAAVLPRLRKITSFPAFLNAMRSQLLHCTVNDEPATAETILQAEAEVIVFTGSLGSRTDRDAHRPMSSAAEPASSSTRPHRPPTPPIPLPAEATIRRWGRAKQLTLAAETATRRIEMADDTAAIGTILIPCVSSNSARLKLVRTPAPFLLSLWPR